MALLVSSLMIPSGYHKVLTFSSIVFCCLLAFEFAVVWFVFPETYGHTLEETTHAARAL